MRSWLGQLKVGETWVKWRRNVPLGSNREVGVISRNTREKCANTTLDDEYYEIFVNFGATCFVGGNTNVPLIRIALYLIDRLSTSLRRTSSISRRRVRFTGKKFSSSPILQVTIFDTLPKWRNANPIVTIRRLYDARRS